MSKIKSLNEMGAAPKTPQVQIKASDLEDIICENCEGKIFKEVMMVKRLSALISPTGKEQVIPVPVLRCDDCGHINKQFLPKEIG
jgi:uncharacterized Zn finger protein